MAVFSTSTVTLLTSQRIIINNPDCIDFFLSEGRRCYLHKDKVSERSLVQTSLLSKIQSADELDQAISTYTDLLITAAKEATPPLASISGSQASHTSRGSERSHTHTEEAMSPLAKHHGFALRSKFSRTCQYVCYLIQQTNNTVSSEFLLTLDATGKH